jgi:hypothetical protein
MVMEARSRAWTVANAIMLLAFMFSVAVQFNDPDPWSWVSIYAAAAIVCALEMGRRARWVAPAVIAAIAGVWAATIAPRVIGRVRFTDMFAEFEMANVGIEESREMYGLLILAAWMTAVAIAAWPRRRLLQRP